VLWSVLQGMVELLMSRWTNHPAAVADVFSFAWAPRAQFWFLYALFAISLLVPLQIDAPHRYRPSYRLLPDRAPGGATIEVEFTRSADLHRA